MERNTEIKIIENEQDMLLQFCLGDGSVKSYLYIYGECVTTFFVGNEGYIPQFKGEN